jgi:urease accessory protein
VSVRLSEGLLELRFAVGPGGRTELVQHTQRFPLRLTVPLYLDTLDTGMAFVYVQNPTGGIFGGDRLMTRVIVEEGARVHLTTSSATKIYRMDKGEAVQLTEIRLGRGSYFEYVPEPLIPQAGSRFIQEICIELSPTATFVSTEMVAPGRFARGEIFKYDRLFLRTTVSSSGGRELCTETLLLEPSHRYPGRRGVLGAYRYLGTLLALAPGGNCTALAARLDESVLDLPSVLAAGGTLPSNAGAFVRILARAPIETKSALQTAWHEARDALAGLPPLICRK